MHGMESQMKAYSVDLRERVLADFQGGMKFAGLGRKYSVSAEWVRQFIRRHQATGEIAGSVTYFPALALSLAESWPQASQHQWPLPRTRQDSARIEISVNHLPKVGAIVV